MIDSIITAARFIRDTFLADDDHAIPAMLDAITDLRAASDTDDAPTLSDAMISLADIMIDDINDAHDATIDLPDASQNSLFAIIRDDCDTLTIALAAMLTIDLLTYFPDADALTN